MADPRHFPAPQTPLQRARQRPAVSGPVTDNSASAHLNTRPLGPADWPAVLELADRLLGFPFNILIRFTRSPAGWVLEDAAGRLQLVQLTRVVNLGAERLGVMGWTLSEPRAQRTARGRAIQAFFDDVHADLRAAGCKRLVVGDSDAYLSPSWRLAHAGGYRRWTLLQQLRCFGWRWPAVLWRLPHCGIRTFVLQRPIDNESAPVEVPGSGLGSAVGVALLFGAVLFPLARTGGFWTAFQLPPSLAESIALSGAAVLIHFSVRAIAQHLVAKRHALRVGYRVWDSGLVAALLLAASGVFMPGIGGGLYVRDQRYNYLADRSNFAGVRAAGVASSLLLSSMALFSLELNVAPSALASAVLSFGLWSGLTDALPLSGPWSATAGGVVRRRHPRLARAFFGFWCVLLVLSAWRLFRV